jgi:hypothetical protein
LGVDIHERVAVVVRADKEDGGNIMRIEGDYHPERPGKVRNANLGEQIITRQPVP